ncbi:MAG: polysaccharide deacetylase family protein [Treponema sp.]|jgi:peptidoglycan/xylan/chitin deacetylase (PgdA/CDA1 family)|nr:polysaccharide deacetylase family protein [Treponema sp.]
MMKNPVPLWLLIIGLCFSPPRIAAKVSFSGLDLSGDDRLLFRADSDADGSPRQSALFVSRLTDLSLRQLTAFPEKMDLLENGRVLQVRNAFGALRIPVAGGLPRSIRGFPSFAEGAPAAGGRVEGMAASGDGKWVLYVEPVTAAYGNLVLIDTATGIRTHVSSDVERPGAYFPACWSPDSRVFVYARSGRLYYQTINISAVPAVDERYRLIGEGAVNSVYWGQAGDFFYMRGSTVYRVRGSEIFVRALYANFLEIGTVAGTIPLEFDPNFDAFWVAPDSRSILLSKGGRNIFYYPLGSDDDNETRISSLPYLMVPRSCFKLGVLWSPGGEVTVIASVPQKNGTGALAYRLNIRDGGTEVVFAPLSAPVGPNAALSPDGRRALLWGPGGVVLYDYINWKILGTISERPAFSCLWTGNEEFITGDELRIERIRLSGSGEPGGARSLICIAAVSDFAFEDRGPRIAARNGDRWFATDGNNSWVEVNSPALREASMTSGRYRVYLERQSSGPYENLPMIRNTASVGTASLLPAIEVREAAPGERLVSGNAAPASSPAGALFTHGKREGLREVGLAFDLYDDAAGLPGVLDALNRFGVRATFFLNGEFIRRHPSAARDIVEAGHETASMFFAPIDLSDARYRIDRDFISRGLARNEDEFYRASGAELGLLWHAPYYAASPDIIAAAQAVGYKTVGRDVDPMDWVLRDEAKRISVSQYSASDMIDLIMDSKQPGSIIPIRLGLLPGGRNDYLFNRIDVLLDALIRSGYGVVPVSTVIEHAR